MDILKVVVGSGGTKNLQLQKLFGKLRQDDSLSPGVWGQHGQHEAPSLQYRIKRSRKPRNRQLSSHPSSALRVMLLV